MRRLGFRHLTRLPVTTCSNRVSANDRQHSKWKPSARYLCAVQMGRQLLPGQSHKLNNLCDYYGIVLQHHQADSDIRACAEILLRYRESGADFRPFIRNYSFAV